MRFVRRLAGVVRSTVVNFSIRSAMAASKTTLGEGLLRPNEDAENHMNKKVDYITVYRRSPALDVEPETMK